MAAGRDVEAPHDVHERRLPGSRLPDDGEEFALVDRNVYVSQGEDLGESQVVGLLDVRKLDERHGISLGPAVSVPSRGPSFCSFFFASRLVTDWMGTVTTRSWVAVAMETADDIPGRPFSGASLKAMRTKKVVTSASVPGFLIWAFFTRPETYPLNCLSGMASISMVASSPSWMPTTSCSPTSALTSISVRPPISITTSSERSDPRMRSPTLCWISRMVPSMGAVRVARERL